MSKTPDLSEEQRAALPPAVQEYLAFLEAIVRPTAALDIDLESASREDLIRLILHLLVRIQALEDQVRELQGSASGRNGEGKGSGSTGESPGSKVDVDPLEEKDRPRQAPHFVKKNRPVKEKKERKKRARGYARKLDKPTHRVEHAFAECPTCSTTITGGRVYYRRQVITLPRIRVRVVEHVVIERKCPKCGQRCVPKPDLSSEVVGKQRVGISVQSEVTALREEHRLPFGQIQRLLAGRSGLRLSIGELVALVQGVAKRAKPEYEKLQREIRDSDVVNGDETGWRQDGRNGYLWSFSTDKVRYFLYRQSRARTVVTEVLGEEFDGVLVSDFYGAYNVHQGFHQRCWPHLLRAVHQLKEKNPGNGAVEKWAKAVQEIYERAKAYTGPDPGLPPDKQKSERMKMQRQFERELWELCAPYVKTEAPMAILCERVERFLPELFTFVADPRVPADNNAAERSLRGPVVSRKISGGTRSDKGSETKSILASLFGTWRLRGDNPYEACLRLLTGKGPLGPASSPVRSPPT